MKLLSIGFKKNWVYEGVASTENNDGSQNNAPMGFLSTDLKTIILRPYKNTRTYKNISRAKKCALHFFELSEENVSSFHDFIWNEKAKKAKKIKSSGRLFLNVEKVEEDKANKARSIITCSVEKAEGKFFLFSRAPLLAFESVLKASKLGLGLEDDALLRAMIKNNLETIKIIAPNSEFEKIAEKCSLL